MEGTQQENSLQQHWVKRAPFPEHHNGYRQGPAAFIVCPIPSPKCDLFAAGRVQNCNAQLRELSQICFFEFTEHQSTCTSARAYCLEHPPVSPGGSPCAAILSLEETERLSPGRSPIHTCHLHLSTLHHSLLPFMQDPS